MRRLLPTLLTLASLSRLGQGQSDLSQVDLRRTDVSELAADVFASPEAQQMAQQALVNWVQVRCIAVQHALYLSTQNSSCPDWGGGKGASTYRVNGRDLNHERGERGRCR